MTKKSGYPLYPKQLRFEHVRRGLTIWLKIIYPHTDRGGDPKCQ